MAWFNQNKKPKGDTELAHDKRVEVVVHQNATKEAVEDAKAANKHLKNLLLGNDDITLKIWVAAGGRVQQKNKRT